MERTLVTRATFGLLAVAFLLGLLWMAVPQSLLAAWFEDDPPPQLETRQFSESGFWVSGEFLTYFDVHGGLEIFGYPISYPFVNDYGVLVQYFQNARMEYHALHPDPYKLQLVLLGDELGYRREPTRSTSLSPHRQYFPETGHSVAYKFLDYFHDHGGIDIFGYPITEMYVENGQLVQHFQRLKLIWDLEMGRIKVGNLGEVYVRHNRNHMPPSAIIPKGSDLRVDPAGPPVGMLRVVVGLADSVVSPGDNQIVTAVVLDDATGEPVKDAPLSMQLYDRENEDEMRWTGEFRTDAKGRVHAAIPLSGFRRGTWVVLRVTAAYGTATASNKELFLVWR